MADSGVPFAIGAENVPLVEDLVDVPVGQSLTIDLLLTGLEDGDVPTAMDLAIKANPNDSNLAPTTVLKTITPTLSASGVLLPTDDPLVWRGVFQMTRREAVRVARLSTYTYSVQASVTRESVSYRRMIQRGALSVNLYTVNDDSPVADGAYYANGTLYADGFAP